MRTLLLAVVFVLVAHSASAVTIGRMLPACEAALDNPTAPPSESEICVFYVAGFADILTSRLLRWPSCPPDGTTVSDVIGALVDWGRQNVEWHQEDISRGLLAAVTEKWPCN